MSPIGVTAQGAYRGFDKEAFVVDDRVTARGRDGTVVGNITTGVFSTTLDSGAWKTLNVGVLVRWGDGSISHYREPAFSLRHSRQPLL